MRRQMSHKFICSYVCIFSLIIFWSDCVSVENSTNYFSTKSIYAKSFPIKSHWRMRGNYYIDKWVKMSCWIRFIAFLEKKNNQWSQRYLGDAKIHWIAISSTQHTWTCYFFFFQRMELSTFHKAINQFIQMCKD